VLVIAQMGSVKYGLTSIKAVTPAPEPAVFLIPALPFIGLALWTTMAVNTINVVTLGLVVAWGHPGDLTEIFLLPGVKLVVVIMTAIQICACVRPLQVKDIAKLELLDSLDFLPRNQRVNSVNSLSKSIPINPRN
jgi:hypothetical protein